MKIATVKFFNGHKDIVTFTKANMTDDQLAERCFQVWGHIGDMEVEIEDEDQEDIEFRNHLATTV